MEGRFRGVRRTLTRNPLVTPEPKPVHPLGNLICIHQPILELFVCEPLATMRVTTTSTVQTPTMIAREATSDNIATAAVESRHRVGHHASQESAGRKGLAAKGYVNSATHPWQKEITVATFF